MSDHARVFLVEDNPLMREVMGNYLDVAPDLDLCGEASSAEEALERLADVQADLLIVDTSLPSMSGIDLVRAVHERWSGLPCLMLSGHAHPLYVQQALDAGASGYVLKGEPSELADAIAVILDGGRYVSPRLQRRLESQG